MPGRRGRGTREGEGAGRASAAGAAGVGAGRGFGGGAKRSWYAVRTRSDRATARRRRFSSIYLWDRVETTRMKRMTAQHAAEGQRGAAAGAMPPNRLGRVDAAARHEPAVAPDEGREEGAVGVNREEQGPRGGPGPGRGR